MVGVMVGQTASGNNYNGREIAGMFFTVRLADALSALTPYSENRSALFLITLKSLTNSLY